MAGSVVQMALALLFATILSFKVRGSKFFRGALYFPCMICGISVGFIFKFFFTRGFVLDTLLGWVGFNMENLPYWLRDESINNIVLVACSLWKYMGQNIVMFIGAIASVDSTLYEAADIDGANAWHRFKDIILPSIRTIVVLNLIISVSGALSAFEIAPAPCGAARRIPLSPAIPFRGLPGSSTPPWFPMKAATSACSGGSSWTASRTFTWDAAPTASTGSMTGTRSPSQIRKASPLCRSMPTTPGW